MELWRGKRFGAADRLAPVLPLVFYTGVSRWTAAPRVIDLVTPGATDGAAPGPGSQASGLFAGDGYLTLDTLRLGTDDLRHDNAAALLAGLSNPALERLPAQAAALRARLDAPALRPLLEVALRWAQQRAERLIGFDMGIDDMAELDRLDGAEELEAYFAQRRQAYQERYRAEGIEQGIAAERALLRRQVARKFGSGAAERLGPLLAAIGDTDGLAAVGEEIIDCPTLEDLIGRLDRIRDG